MFVVEFLLAIVIRITSTKPTRHIYTNVDQYYPSGFDMKLKNKFKSVLSVYYILGLDP